MALGTGFSKNGVPTNLQMVVVAWWRSRVVRLGVGAHGIRTTSLRVGNPIRTIYTSREVRQRREILQFPQRSSEFPRRRRECPAHAIIELVVKNFPAGHWRGGRSASAEDCPSCHSHPVSGQRCCLQRLSVSHPLRHRVRLLSLAATSFIL